MWKPITGFEGLYEVSDSGEVRSLDRMVIDSVGHRYMVRGRILKQNGSNGYLMVDLCKNGIRYPLYVHILVATAFIPNPNNLPTVNHKDGNKFNCSVSNLEWASYSDNNQHAYCTGLKECGEKFYNAKLTEEQVFEIRKNGKYTTYEKIAEKYGVSRATIRDVLELKSWRNTNPMIDLESS